MGEYDGLSHASQAENLRRKAGFMSSDWKSEVLNHSILGCPKIQQKPWDATPFF